MKTTKSLSLFKSAAATVLLATACGPIVGKSPLTPSERPSERPAANESASNDEAEMITMLGATAAGTANAYEHCAQILIAAVNTSYRTMTQSQRDVVTSQLLTMDEGKLVDEVYSLLHDEQSSADSAKLSIAGRVGLSWLSIEPDADHTYTTAKERLKTKEDIQNAITQWKRSESNNNNTSTLADKTFTLRSMVADKDAVDAWQSCVARENNGLFCGSHVAGDNVVVTVKWSPNAVQAKLLPVLNYEMATNDLVVTQSPKRSTIGTGSGVSFLMKRVDPFKFSSVAFRASDSEDRVNYACHVVVPPEKRLVKNFKNELVGYEMTTCERRVSAPSAEPVYGASMNCPGSLKADIKTIISNGPTASDGLCKDHAPAPDACPAGYVDQGSRVTRQVTCYNPVGGLNTKGTRVKERRRTCARAEKPATCEIGVKTVMRETIEKYSCEDKNRPVYQSVPDGEIEVAY